MPPSPDVEEVVLLGPAGEPIGSVSKVSVHGPETPLHLAFSCYVVNQIGKVLMTRRSLSKATWPGVWSKSFCGHPRPAEPVLAAVGRSIRPTPWAFSPWLVLQAQLLPLLGGSGSRIRSTIPSTRHEKALR